MWEYYLDGSDISQAISARAKLKKSEQVANELLRSLGYVNENLKKNRFDDLVFTKGSLDETYSSEEILFCENVGNIFLSRNNDIFDFFLIDIDEEKKFDACYLGMIIKIINKAFKGENIIIFQSNKSLMFGSRYISRFAGRDFHFTYWISDIAKIRMFSAYNLCRKNKKYSYALYLAMVCQKSLFKHRWWTDNKDEAEELDVNYMSLSRELEFIVSNQIDSFKLLDKALQTSEYIKTDEKMSVYREEYDAEDDLRMYDEEELIFNVLKM